jgi:hypothetical protein
MRAGHPIRAFHKRCHDIRPYSFAPAFEAVTAYSYNPSYNDDYLRAKRISNIAARRLCWIILHKLPEEVCNIITEHIVLELATVGLREILSPLKSIKKTSYELDLNKDIYVAYQAIEGVTYIRRLSNEKTDDKARLIHKASENQKLRPVYVAFDHFGVRDVYFENPPDDCLIWAGSPPYWINVSVTEMPLMCTHDVGFCSIYPLC